MRSQAAQLLGELATAGAHAPHIRAHAEVEAAAGHLLSHKSEAQIHSNKKKLYQKPEREGKPDARVLKRIPSSGSSKASRGDNVNVKEDREQRSKQASKQKGKQASVVNHI